MSGSSKSDTAWIGYVAGLLLIAAGYGVGVYINKEHIRGQQESERALHQFYQTPAGQRKLELESEVARINAETERVKAETKRIRAERQSIMLVPRNFQSSQPDMVYTPHVEGLTNSQSQSQ